jgi:hypothetical protein
MLLGPDEHQLQATDLSDLVWHLLRQWNTGLQKPWLGRTGLLPPRTENKVPPALQDAKGFDAPAALKPSPCIYKPELLAETVGQFGALNIWTLSQVLPHPFYACRLRQSSANLTLSCHTQSLA